MRAYEDTFSGDKIYPGKVRVFHLSAGLCCGCSLNSDVGRPGNSSKLTMVYDLFAGKNLRSW